MLWKELKGKVVFLPKLAKWLFISALIGVMGSLLGAGFHYVLVQATELRSENNWLIFLLPIGGILTVVLYGALKLKNNKGTNETIIAVKSGKPLSFAIAPAIFIATFITQLFGGSAGREGAALQIGGSASSLINKLFRLKERETTVVTLCGMGAVFSGLFVTPLTACIFVLEFVSVGSVFLPALLPCFISAFVAGKVSYAFGVRDVTIAYNDVFKLNFHNSWRILILAVAISVLGIVMCYILRKAEYFADKLFTSPYIKILVGAVIIIVLTMIVGDQRFNGAGMDMVTGALNGNTDWYSFALKLVFTAITLAAGFKGGEIVPTFCIGATFGCMMGNLLGIDPAFAAMLGLAGLFCAVTNSPLASIVLSIEMFGITNIYIFVLICLLTFVLSGKCSLYSSQTIESDKLPMRGNI